jgi:hypothetical protein
VSTVEYLICSDLRRRFPGSGRCRTGVPAAPGSGLRELPLADRAAADRVGLIAAMAVFAIDEIFGRIDRHKRIIDT